MNVYMRTSDEARGSWFCDWNPTRMDELVAALLAGGGVYSGDSEFITDISYQFIHDERGSGAEIVLHTEAA